MDPEAMFRPKVSPKAVVGDSVAAIAATLFPGAMLGFPPVRAMQSPTAPFNVLLVSGLRMLIARLLALMLGRWSVLMAAPQFLRRLRRPVGRPLLLSAIVPFLLANASGSRLQPLATRRALPPTCLLVSFLLHLRVILFLLFLPSAFVAVLGVSRNYES